MKFYNKRNVVLYFQQSFVFLIQHNLTQRCLTLNIINMVRLEDGPPDTTPSTEVGAEAAPEAGAEAAPEAGAEAVTEIIFRGNPPEIITGTGRRTNPTTVNRTTNRVKDHISLIAASTMDNRTHELTASINQQHHVDRNHETRPMRTRT
jgi:hypothetical protein